MDINSDVKKLIKIDEIIKEGLEDETKAMKDILVEVSSALKELKNIIVQTKFEEINPENKDDILAPAANAINTFISDLSPLEGLDDRFAKIKEHALFLKEKLETMKDTLNVYGSTEKAKLDFENNIIYGFKTTVLRDFKQDIEFNKRLEESLE